MGRIRDLFKILIGHVLRTEKLRNDFQICAWIPIVFTVILSSSQFIVAEKSDSHSYKDSELDFVLLNETNVENSLFFEEPSQNHHDQNHHFTHQWAIHILGGKENADRIAEKHGFINTGEIFPSYYHFVHRRIVKRSVKPSHEYHSRLSAEPEVRWLQQQKVKRRSKRDFMSFSSVSPSSSKNSGGRLRSARKSRAVAFNDPRWPGMWYLNRGAGLDMNVIEAWNEGITGKGIVVTILDDGLEKDHPDIVRNYDPMASFDVNSLDMDPMPTYDLTDSNRHGTRCAGEVAAEANNSICAVGIAYEAGVGGVRMLDGDVTDAVEARSLSHNPQHIDIYSASWGPDDDGKTVDGPGELATRAFVEGVTKGRSGKGSIFVWASGNGGRDHDNCNCDGYTNSIWTLSISSATENGLVPWYSEACSSTLATTYSSGGTGEKQIVTIDLHHSCTSSHTGTSASAPLAAGICALALQANMNLTWRDMQHIVVRTARPQNLIAPDWATNGVGRNVSHSFGYGLMDAGAMVKLARKWKTVPEQNKCEIRAPYSEKNIPAKSKVTLDLKVTNCTGVNFLEHVQAKVTLTSGRRGDLQIFLVSPSGTRSVLLAHRRHDLNRSGFTDWPFMTVHSWGEHPIGKWTLEIHNEGRYVGKLQTWALVAHGITADPNGQDGGSGIGGGEKKEGAAVDTAVAGSDPSAVVEFDGSDNTIVMPSHVHSPPLASNAEVADSSVSIATSVASSPSSSNCAKVSANGQCLECNGSLSLLHGKCFANCPENFFRRSRNLATAYVSMGSEKTTTSYTNWACLPCHYTCRTCSGSNDYECLSCHSDSTLHKVRNGDQGAHCYPVVLLDQVDTYAFWYKSLVVTVLVNVLIVLTLGSYICCRNRRSGRLGLSLDGQSGNWCKQRQPYHRIAREDEIEKDNEHHDDDDLSEGIDYDSDDLNESSSDRGRVTFSSGTQSKIQGGINVIHSLSDKRLVESESFRNGRGQNEHSKRVPLVHVLPISGDDILSPEKGEELSKK